MLELTGSTGRYTQQSLAVGDAQSERDAKEGWEEGELTEIRGWAWVLQGLLSFLSLNGGSQP